jgi:hypothetical protein
LERKTYKFSNGLEAQQEELTLEQDYKLAELIGELKLDNLDELSQLRVKDVLKLLVNENVVEKFLNIILVTASNSQGSFKTLRNSEVKQVVEDFFTLNPLLSSAFKILNSAPDTPTMNPKSSSLEESAENTTTGF